MLMWAVIGIVGLAALLISFRIARRRSLSFEGYKARRDAEFQRQEKEMDAAAFRMPSQERLHIVRAGLEDLLRLADYPEGYSLDAPEESKARAESILLHTPDGTLHLGFVSRESLPPLQWRSRSVNCGAHAAPGIWRIWNDEHGEDFPSMAALMCRMNQFLRGGPLFEEEAPKINRRFAGHMPS